VKAKDKATIETIAIRLNTFVFINVDI